MSSAKKKRTNTVTDAFFNLAIEKFQFLIDEFGFKKKASREETGGIYRVAYQNKTTAVEVIFEWREQYIYVRLYRLIDGKKQDDPIIVQPESELNEFDLEDLISIREPSLGLDSDAFGKALSAQDIEFILDNYATAIHKHATDILQGDFSIFPELERIVKSRI